MKYLITGASGFLGKAISKNLSSEASIHSLGRSHQNHIICDLSTESPKFESSYDIVIHCAGKAHSVPKNKNQADEFFKVNYQGTLNLLEGIEQSESLPKSFILISSVAVYGREMGLLLDENTSLNASDPYGQSKKMAEDAVQEWGKSHNVKIGILRLPLIAGPNPPGNLGKMIKALRGRYFFHIGAGDARRSMVPSADIAGILPKLSETGGIFNLTDGYHPSFVELTSVISKKFNITEPYHIPISVAEILAKVGDILYILLKKHAPFNSSALIKMTNSLTFSDEKARRILTWSPQKVLDSFE
ncbi:NAD(P)-dependent oxidoreductase [Roseivirga sp. E12]|uniref:NAD-dependent epimerase/dehydratase family protein n=1 Tax=Roseivirga sp. E12 TaxID=2819237 RepID=UPI001ABCCC57|nr:NAD-dependent epimerase/dehydratase family protein [Roseivirga sp. E12]MBO3699069.1 NAD-dependent epimerase/dehydratase family protein [Roseivirga sp. E12]